MPSKAASPTRPVTAATCFPQVQFFVLSAAEYAVCRAFSGFNSPLPGPSPVTSPCLCRRGEDAIDSITHGFTDTLRTIRQQFKRRDWTIGDDWARQVWWNLKSFRYATLDLCWLLRRERPTDISRAALILEAEGLAAAARALTEWPELEALTTRLKRDPISWVLHWEPRISAAYAEVRPYLRGK